MLNGRNGVEQLKRIHYRPILVQEFIAGRDICASIYCRSGRITAFVAYENRKRVHSAYWSETIFGDVERIAAHANLDGVCNFDMIAGDDGNTYFLECNPRFFFSMNLSMLAGINFVGLGLSDDDGPDPVRLQELTNVRSPEAVLTSPRSWFRLTRRDWAAARYAFSDPIPFVLDHLGWLT
jgi:hypothetical protein